MSAFMLVFISGLLFGIAFGAFLWIPLTLCGLERRKPRREGANHA